jgi:hypothetical protein
MREEEEKKREEPLLIARASFTTAPAYPGSSELGFFFLTSRVTEIDGVTFCYIAGPSEYLLWTIPT